MYFTKQIKDNFVDFSHFLDFLHAIHIIPEHVLTDM